jgi:hypothetical protein
MASKIFCGFTNRWMNRGNTGRQSEAPYRQEAGKDDLIASGFLVFRTTPAKGYIFRRTGSIELLNIKNLIKLGAFFSQRALDTQVLSL